MKCNILICLLLLMMQGAGAQPSRHVILISIDGMRPEFYLSDSFPTPHLKQLMKQGAYAKQMRSVFPSYTYPSHAAMLTGALPARSGIHYNVKRGLKQWNWMLSDIKVPTIWQAAKIRNIRTAAIQWPISVGDDITYNVPEIWDTLRAHDRITVARRYATTGLVEELELHATGRLDAVNMSEHTSQLDVNAGKMAAYVFRKYTPGLLAVHFTGADYQQHENGRDDEKVKQALKTIDSTIGHILKTVEDCQLSSSTTILVVGDHGFSDTRVAIRPNSLLKNAGLAEKVKFQSANGASFLYGSDTFAIRKARELFDTLYGRKCFTILEKDRLTTMGADPDAVFALSAHPRCALLNGDEEPVWFPTRGATHGYDPQRPEMMTGFIAAGAGIRKGKVIEDLCVTDIAPLLAAILKLSFTAPDGKLIPGLLE
ncbi:alkaline phosphatase family protein [Pseudobacter ginsenosidimutans]|uniref:Putative AlkP superfamily pyrophosphatase or phosphodiesterase n=1 Tax=Pseudobacter ginsenosidimutans TaxID=661488 RepID=A0A4Q7N5T8_9BACT|nr:ectonucleotide pyrophosphatase/phosphodiesterase [Pseudobacter ginsenosidimutans]RZS76424.1 putative AlkP superfamily pyrophosphatase or phosphodiesterase [Pseudobacter ginsenosidimutans]